MYCYIKAFLAIGFLISMSKACSSGCLRCNTTTQTCSVCDYENGYIPNDSGSCTFSPIVGCSERDAEGGCYRCSDGRYYEATTKTCLIPVKINFCRIYENALTCKYCFSNYYLSENTCVPVSDENKINQCSIYSSENTCAECERGAIPSIDRTTCTSVNTNSCSNYRNYYCNRCDSSQTLSNKNAYLIKSFSENDESGMRTTLTKLSGGANNTLINSFCMATTVSNCKIFTAFNKCDTCNDGYFLTESKSCQQYIINDLNGCFVYLSETECFSCRNGYYLTGATCALSTQVDECDTYASSEDSCSRCIDDYFLFDGACAIRQVSVENCSVYTADEETCEKCVDGYAIDETGLVCIDLPDNCNEIATYDAETGETTCQVCNSGYYLLEGVCIEGSIDNCDVYVAESDVCEKCNDNYGFSEGQCVEYDNTIKNCETYEVDLPTRCKTCDYDSEMYHQSVICLEIPIIPSCLTYSITNACEKCEEGYELIEGSCNEIPSEEHCLVKQDGNCTRCVNTHNLVEGQCLAVPSYYLANCGYTDLESLGIEYNCLACSTGHIPINNVNEICVNATEQTFELIDYCQKYVDENGTISCQLCNLSYTLSSDRSSCLETCPGDQVKYIGILNIHDNSIADVSAFAQCVDIENYDDLPEGCEVASHNLKSDENVCLKCVDGFIPIEVCTLDSTFFNIDDLSAINEGQSYSVVSCAQQTESTVLIPSFASPDPNCQHYYPIGNKYYCKQCKFGITGVIETDGQGNPYVNCINDFEDCDSSIRLGTGFVDDSWLNDMYGFNLTYEFTCHKCTDSNKIPFIHLSDEGNLLPYELNATDINPSLSAALTGEMTVCREPTKEGLYIEESNFTSFPDNCALGLIIVDLDKSVDIAAPSIRCLACKDGFRKVFDETGFYVESCEAIENCASDPDNGWFDGCKTCSEGYIKHLNVDGKFDINSCSQQSTIVHCRLYNVEQEKCEYCEKGYYLDYDGNCASVHIPGCEHFVQKSALKFKLSNDTINYSYVYYFGALSSDCYACYEGYVAFNPLIEKPICSQYEGLENQTIEENSNFTENCSAYYLNQDNILSCYNCVEEFLINETFDNCYSQELNPNCHITTEDGSLCFECNNNSIIKDGVCYLKLENCETNEFDGDTVICTKCFGDYVISENLCVIDENNCAIYAENGDCEKCITGYFLHYNMCMEIPEFTKCISATTSEDESKLLICDQCRGGYYINAEIDSNDYPVCLDGKSVANCIKYSESFECEACLTEFYVSDGECVERVNLDSHCDIYNLTADECNRCVSDYVITDNGCVEVLNNVPFCIKYSQEGICSLCGANRYLKDNECILVPDDSEIGNCKYYSDLGICYECNDNYLLQDNVCILKVALNCSAYADANVCGACPTTHYFKVRSGTDVFTRDCLLASIENCLAINNYSGNCVQCDTNYYAQGKTCTEVENVIENCKIYKNSSTCRICQQGYILSTNGSSCTFNEDVAAAEPYCVDLKFDSSPVCTACRNGYYFNSNKCVVCPNSTAEQKRCMYCNPEDTSKCLVCKNGNYMNSNGTCEVNIAGLESDNDDDSDEGISISGTFGVIMALLLVLLK